MSLWKEWKVKKEGHYTMPPMPDRYQPREGLEGPFMTKSGKVLYYDPKEGKYYDSDSDFYLSDDDYHAYDNPPNHDPNYETMYGKKMGQ